MDKVVHDTWVVNWRTLEFVGLKVHFFIGAKHLEEGHREGHFGIAL